jgi:hypothetical protein
MEHKRSTEWNWFCKPLIFLERETGVEPATSSLGSWHSTTELLPLALLFFYLPVLKALKPLYRESSPSIASIQNHGV